MVLHLMHYDDMMVHHHALPFLQPSGDSQRIYLPHAVFGASDAIAALTLGWMTAVDWPGWVD